MRWEKHELAENMAKEYVETLNSPANAWGQHIHKGTGLASHYYYSKMVNLFGDNVTRHKIDREFSRLRKLAIENMGSKS